MWLCVDLMLYQTSETNTSELDRRNRLHTVHMVKHTMPIVTTPRPMRTALFGTSLSRSLNFCPQQATHMGERTQGEIAVAAMLSSHPL